MRRSNGIRLALILLVAIVAGWIALPVESRLRFPIGNVEIDLDFRIVQGLDLQGGLQVLLQADPPAGAALSPEAITAARDIIEQRVNAFGTTEPVIQIQGEDRIVVELPGVKTPEDRERAVRLFGETGLLEFMDVGTAFLPPGTVVQEGQYPTILTGKNLDPRAVGVAFDERNRPQINFGWDPEGARIFGEFTETHVGQNLAIVLDKTVLSAPRINSRIADRGVITGGFTLAEARDIVTKLKYGALPIPMKVIQQREVGASLGQESIRMSIQAGVVGLSVVMAFMLIYYRLPGLIANLALLIYAAVAFSIFKNPWQPVTLTLAGIAGFILSIGMAVDANILIFERTKEELRTGRTLGAAVEAGFTRAWSSIWDSNSTTLIITAILFWFGTGMIRGFAVTLAIGVIVSLFTSIFVTRTLLRSIVSFHWAQQPWMFGTSVPQTESIPARRPSGFSQVAGA